MTESGGITYRNEDIDEPERIAAKDKVYEIVRTTAEYMRQMETAPFLKADGLEDGYKVLADFNDIVLAGIQSKYGVQFVTWDWSFDRKGVCHGHYYTGLYSSGNYDAAKRDFAVRSGLIPKQQVFQKHSSLRYTAAAQTPCRATLNCHTIRKKRFRMCGSRLRSACLTLWSASSSRTRNRRRNRQCNIERYGPES